MDAITATRKLECELDFLYFTRYFFKQRFGNKMIVSAHHIAIASFIADVISGKIKRGIINIPPGYTKTELASISLIAYGIAINQKSRFLHLSYSNSLALQNSATAKGIVNSDEFQDMWPIDLKDDAKAKEIWWTEKNGGVRATSTMGQVTGFRAGHMDHSDDNFTGALIIDDPVKPEDAYSDTIRNGVNNNFNETISSRVAIEDVPIIVIMQRIHYDDLSGYLLRGGSGEKWHHLNLPVQIDSSTPYPSEYTHGIPYEHGVPNGWLWPFKHNDEHEEALKSHKRKYRAQYMQDPIKRDEETALWTEKLMDKAKSLDFGESIKTVVSVDPAASNDETSDEHGIVAVSQYGPNQYGVNKDRTRKGSPNQWAQTAITLYEETSAYAIVIETNQGGDMCESTLRNAGFAGKIIRVHATKGKVLRAEPVAALYELGYVSHDKGLEKAEEEMLDFDVLTGKSNGQSPNRVDAIVHGITELAGLRPKAAILRRKRRR